MDIKQLGLAKPGTAGQPAVEGRRAEKAGTAAAPAAAPATVRSTPEVEVSAEAKAIGAALNQVATQPEVDQAKVARIKAAIDEGRYTVSAERLAGKMIRFEEGFGEVNGRSESNRGETSKDQR
ncbi:flagellar biosynthesis anti-sigma factor FlgM [Permianibacter sp. IMCC34836]|uniref:flagellar biosynthesis anti-sigma factor FlgM n=1 Tax=Permianibacter fluminis TaxID=2738515 RepID=UPI00155491D6|nr:flagellar biosynthesis anti-sigma factor FlgM [Permianibacter fluminis]NQD38076.1 flagellar biosynthesis anti-sigma factor FlgM [Permianibacter fluminis]